MKRLYIYFLPIILPWIVNAQVQEKVYRDPCGFPDTTSAEFRLNALVNWGYGYDSLKADLIRWGKSPFVAIDSIGATVQQRTVYMMTIQDTAAVSTPRKRIWIHARTHPNEVQGTWVTNEIIKILLTDTLAGKRLRDGCIFNIVPMYNPDGVELGKSRENANGIDLESNWNTNPSQPEVQVLRGVFTRLMSQPNPILVALNMHSALVCKRYFVYHDSSGTSQKYSQRERKYINLVGGYFPGNIQPWNYFISWVGVAAKQYPESWFWYNYHDSVLALTYEDMNCTANGNYDSTAAAILQGAADFLDVSKTPVGVFVSNTTPEEFQLAQNYPNPFNSITNYELKIKKEEFVRLKVYDILGREVATLVHTKMSPGIHRVQWNAEIFASGVYFCRMTAGGYNRTIKVILNK